MVIWKYLFDSGAMVYVYVKRVMVGDGVGVGKRGVVG